MFGIGGQVAAAAPIIVVTATLSHTAGLTAAGHFVIAAGASAVLYACLFLGFVYYVVIDRLENFDARDFMLTRLAATVLAGALLFAIARWMSLPLELVALVMLLRSSDAAVDLAWGLDLLREPPGQAMRRYAFLNAAKLMLVLLPMGLLPLLPAVESTPLLLIGAGLGTALCWSWLLKLSWGSRASSPPERQLARSLRLVRMAVWFSIGVAVCAGAVNAPRLLLEYLHDSSTFGVAGVSLTFSTVYSMAFMSSWLRWFPALSEKNASKRPYTGMVSESIAMAIAFTLCNLTFAPYIAGFIFDFRQEGHIELCRSILHAAVFFGLAMNMANLFKLSQAVWLESVVYAFGIACGIAFVLISPQNEIPGYLLAAGACMLGATVAGLTWLARTTPTAPTDKPPLAVFLRLASRPVPRVTRMMTVAREAGMDAVFVGALRDASLPVEDRWETFPIRRVGRPFPLLNGKRPWLYVSSVINCNFAFYRLLRKLQPTVVHASDFETIPASLLFRLLHGGRLVYNIHDNLGQRYSLPAIACGFLTTLESVAVLLTDQAIVPEDFRRNAFASWCRYKVVVIRNLPRDEGPTVPPAFENGVIRIFYGGWLDWQRGLEALLALSEEEGVEVRIAGEGTAEIVQALKNRPKVTYLGFLDSAAVLEETRRCHFVPVLYDPSRVINRFAASNKLAEALSIGRPMIINRELEIFSMMAYQLCAIGTEYSNAGKIGPRLRALASDEQAYLAACKNARELFERHYDWQAVKSLSRDVLLGRDSNTRSAAEVSVLQQDRA